MLNKGRWGKSSVAEIYWILEEQHKTPKAQTVRKTVNDFD